MLNSCKEKRCKKPPGKKSGGYCYKHAQDRKRERDPVKYAFWTLKNNAKRRKIPFNLTFEQFVYFAEKVDLFGNRGKSKNSWHIDRKIEADPRGYHIENIQVLTIEQNTHKEYARRAARKELNYDWKTKSGYWVFHPPEFEIGPDCPF